MLGSTHCNKRGLEALGEQHETARVLIVSRWRAGGVAARCTGATNGYGAYNPASIVKMLGIFRVFYNYCAVGKDGKTPAMRLGLAKGVVDLEDIIYF
jgi:hypothetical protein